MIVPTTEQQLYKSNYSITTTTLKTAAVLTSKYAQQKGRLASNYTSAKWTFIDANRLADAGVYMLLCCNYPVAVFSVDILDNWLLFGRFATLIENRKLPIPQTFMCVALLEEKMVSCNYNGIVYTGNLGKNASLGTLDHDQLQRLYKRWEKVDPKSTLVSNGLAINKRFVFLAMPTRFRGVTQVVRYIPFEGVTQAPDIRKMDDEYYKKITLKDKS